MIKSTDMFVAVGRDTQGCGAKQVRHRLKSDKQFTQRYRFYSVKLVALVPTLFGAGLLFLSEEIA